ncbi:ABC transporter ATP-binding protein [Saccharomonospora piscinae]|uniref:ABC transporter ATP-binding protein n=1 Tax=Saccharomonospora piscinae TaxID=687388 RepID=UPI0004669A1E|nr:ATP-binding cassette domain-containing protein [Saccharomonospora piscinae]
MSDEPIYRLRRVGVDYPLPTARDGHVTGLDDVTLDVPATGLTVLAGPSGSGKSTLLRVLALFQPPTRGRVVFAGAAVGPSPRERRAVRRHGIGLVFQTPTDNLLPTLSVADNLHAAAQSARRRADAEDLLTRMGLAGTGRWRIPALSGGQQQRLAFACALARGCPVVLADEPTSQLDDTSAGHVLDAITRLVDQGVPVVATSHDDRVVERGDRVVRLRAGRLTDQEEHP